MFQRYIFSKINYLKKKPDGFSLIELFITLFLTLLVITIIYSTFLFNQRAYEKGETSAEIIQNGRVVLERMSREIRQAKEIVTNIPEEELSPPDEIFFQDGHISPYSESGQPQITAETKNIKLRAEASSVDDYYKDAFIEIIQGPAIAEDPKKIIEYDGSTKTATLEEEWSTLPTTESTYLIDTSYYYIRYFKDPVNETDIRRQIITYFFGDNPNKVYTPWNARDEFNDPPGGPHDCSGFEECLNCPPSCLILEEKLIGEYVTELKFWGVQVIDISITLEKNDRSIGLKTKIFGRNL